MTQTPVGRACHEPVRSTDPLPEPSGRAIEQLTAVADAVLYEGYLLYPYRRSSPKNRVRWQFGVLFPRDWVEREGPVVPGMSGSADSWYQQTECLLRVRCSDPSVRITVRYLQTLHKQVEEAGPDGRHRPVASLSTQDGTAHLTFDEAVPCEREAVIALADLQGRGHVFPVGAPAGEETEYLPGGVGRVVRRRTAVHATTTVTAERVTDDVCRLRVRTENTGRAPETRSGREEALPTALIATHTLFGGEGVEFVSLIDPPAQLRAQARACRNDFTFPVLGGGPPAGTADPHHARALLSAPIILSDQPRVAPESPGDLHDAAEIDEILTLRTMLLTDEEKREARATDDRAAQILDRVETMPPEVFSRLHGAIRSLAPARPPTATLPGRTAWWQEGADEGLSPTTDTVPVGGVLVGGGSRVRLRPRARGADAQDMFLAGRTAHVEAVLHDVDGSVHLAVTLDDDPAAELNSWYGRFHHFRTDEVEPLDAAPSSRPPDARPEPPATTPEKGRTDGRS